MGELKSNCVVIVRAEGQMPDLSTSPALLDMQKSRVSRLTECMNSLNHGEIVPVVVNTIKTNFYG
jgi:hypothetical protein